MLPVIFQGSLAGPKENLAVRSPLLLPGLGMRRRNKLCHVQLPGHGGVVDHPASVESASCNERMTADAQAAYVLVLGLISSSKA